MWRSPDRLASSVQIQAGQRYWYPMQVFSMRVSRTNQQDDGLWRQNHFEARMDPSLIFESLS